MAIMWRSGEFLETIGDVFTKTRVEATKKWTFGKFYAIMLQGFFQDSNKKASG